MMMILDNGSSNASLFFLHISIVVSGTGIWDAKNMHRMSLWKGLFFS